MAVVWPTRLAKLAKLAEAPVPSGHCQPATDQTLRASLSRGFFHGA